MKRSGPRLVLMLAAVLFSSALAERDSAERPADAGPTEGQTKKPAETPDCPDIMVAKSEARYKAPQQFEGLILPGDAYPKWNTTGVETCPGLPDKNAGRQYNWWQVLVELGGAPGTLNGTKGMPDNSPLTKPCERPLAINDSHQYLYEKHDSDFKSFYRHETVYPRFQGSSKAFDDVRGELIWTPPETAHDTRVYSLTYNLDDLGFWVIIDNSECTFIVDTKTVYCVPLLQCVCLHGELNCYSDHAVGNPLLLASLVGAG